MSNAQGLCVKGGNWRASRSEVYVLHLILSQNHAYYYRVSCADLLAFAHRITILVYIMYFDQIVSMVIVCVCVCVCDIDSVWRVIWWSVGHRQPEASTLTGDMYKDGQFFPH